MIHVRAKHPHHVPCLLWESRVETELAERSKMLSEPISALAMTSSEQWHNY